YEDLVRACGAHVVEVTRPPTPDVLAGVRSLDGRVRLAVAEIFAYYERSPHFERARCDRDRLDALRVAVAARDQLLAAVVREALLPAAGGDEVGVTVSALVDFAVYRALVGAGMSTSAASDRIADVALTWVRARRRRSDPRPPRPPAARRRESPTRHTRQIP